ncbi:MAG: L-threonylcarbamoyladenylate synthase [Acidimicrobiales bacterium]
MPAVLSASDGESIGLAAEALRDGLVVAVPTDTVYGLAVDPRRPGAVARLFAMKERPAEVPLPVLVGERDQVDIVARPLDRAAEHLASRYWPGPLTLVVPRRYGFTADLGGPPSALRMVGVRWTDHPVVRSLCHRLGPLAVTSANLHGRPPSTTARQVMASFSGVGAPAVVLDGGTCDGLPSTVVECRGPASRCLREGAIPWDELAEDSSGAPSEDGARRSSATGGALPSEWLFGRRG